MNNLPTITGQSEKQVKYAEDIREKLYPVLIEKRERRGYEAVIEWFQLETNAAEIIYQGADGIRPLVKICHDNLLKRLAFLKK